MLSFPGLVSMNYSLFFILRQPALLHYIGRFFEERIFNNYPAKSRGISSDT